MAAEQQQSPVEAVATQHSAQVVGNAFVQQYYHVLHQSPELVYRFYQETSKLGRPEDEGAMIPITTMQAINEKIVSLEYSKYKAEIKTVDAQDSLDGGVLVLVTGYLTSEDDVKRKFTQSFFLATQDKGYFVLNDIFRYIDEAHPRLGNSAPETISQPSAYEQDITPPEHAPEESVTQEEEEENVEEVYNPSEVDEGSVVDEEVPSNNVTGDVLVSPHVIEPSPSVVQEEAPKKSYASIVKVKKENVASVSASASTQKTLPGRQEWQVSSASAPTLATENASSSFSTTSSDAVQEAADGFSIYIKNLPLNATPEQLEEEFKKFGPIKYDGVQVRSHKQGFCFGFVEFEVASAVQSAIEASPIMIGGRQAYVEEKRPSGSRANSRSRYTPERGGGFRGEGTRGHGSYSGRGYGRGDFNTRSDFMNRIFGRGGSANRGDVGYQRVESGSRMNRPGGLSSNSSSKDTTHWVPAS